MAHFADLTAINCPLGELDDDTYAQLMVAWRNGGGIEYWSTLFGEWCSTIGPEWDPETKYRLAATTATPDFIPWGTVHRDFNFHARDADGQRHFFAIRPDIGETRWKLQGNKVVSSAATAGIIIGDKLWDQSMVCRPRWEGK